jgi:hypothetical protein
VRSTARKARGLPSLLAQRDKHLFRDPRKTKNLTLSLSTPQSPGGDREGRDSRGLVEVLREEGIDAVRYVLWDATGWHRDYSPLAWRIRATEEQKRIGWEMAVRIEKILCTVLHEAHKLQVEEAMDIFSEGPEGLCKSYLSKSYLNS